MATPRTTTAEHVDAWIHDYVENGATIAEQHVGDGGQTIPNWGKLARNRFKELGIEHKTASRRRRWISNV